MRSTLGVLVGCQEPRILVAPPSMGTAGLELIELCEGVGMRFDPAQRLALIEICAEQYPGKWAAMETLVEEARQNGKGLIIEALQLGDLFLFDSELSTYSAHEFPTAMEQHRRLCFWIENTDDLRRRCRKPTVANGNVGVETLDGRRVKFRARTNDGGRGLTGDRIILDEAFDLPKEAIGALVPSLSAVPNPQINYFSSTGFGADQPKSDVMWEIRKQALVSALRHLDPEGDLVEPEDDLVVREVPGAHVYLNWSAPPSARQELDDERHVARANPAYGRRISAEYVFGVERKRMTDDEQFARERLGIWPASRKLAEDADGESMVQLWRTCEYPASKLTGEAVYAVDVSPDQRSAAIWVAGGSTAGGRHLQLVEYRPGASWVVDRLEGLRSGPVGLNPSGPAGVLVPDLEAAGFKVHPVSGASFAGACGLLVGLMKEPGQLRQVVPTIRPDQSPTGWDEAMATALAGAVKNRYGDGGFTWSRRSSAVDICLLVAASIALAVPVPAGPTVLEGALMA